MSDITSFTITLTLKYALRTMSIYFRLISSLPFNN